MSNGRVKAKSHTEKQTFSSQTFYPFSSIFFSLSPLYSAFKALPDSTMTLLSHMSKTVLYLKSHMQHQQTVQNSFYAPFSLNPFLSLLFCFWQTEIRRTPSYESSACGQDVRLMMWKQRPSSSYSRCAVPLLPLQSKTHNNTLVTVGPLQAQQMGRNTFQLFNSVWNHRWCLSTL